MNVFVTQDRRHYRRWINVLVSLLFPGSGHFLTGRKTAALGCFMASMLAYVLRMWLLIRPGSQYTLDAPGFIDLLFIPLALIIAGDSCRWAIPRLSFKRWTLFVAAFLVAVPGPWLFLVKFVVIPFNIPTGAMAPTIQGVRTMANGETISSDRILVNLFIYRFSRPQRGDIVVFSTTGISDPRVRPNQYHVKRVVGLPGEHVRMEPPFVLINGQRLQAPPIFARMAQGLDGYGGYIAAEWFAKETDEVRLGTDEYLVLGDNSRNSMDSRFFGPIRGRAIIGKVFYRYAPAGRKGWVE